jgi:hypothetical protein
MQQETKAKRYKKVFSSHREVCHIWAQRSQDEGKASRIFFEGNSIYSYGYRFKMAAFVEHKGQVVVLLNSENYSISTGKHKNYVRRAISQYEQFDVPNLPGYGSMGEEKHAVNVTAYENEAIEFIKKAARARQNKEWLLRSAMSEISEMKRYAEFFDVKLTDSQQDLINRMENNQILTDEIVAELKEREKVRRQAVLEKNKEEIAEWLKGERYSLPSSIDKVFLRRKDDTIETSMGANVSVVEARLLHHAIKNGMDIKGRKIGYYTVLSFNGKILTVGCHKIEKSEIDRFAKSQNWQ